MKTRPFLLFAAVILSIATGPAETQAQRRETGFLPSPVFRTLLADPLENQFGTSLRSGDFAVRGSLEGIASFGATVPIVGFGSDSAGSILQVGIAGGAIARFDMHTRANDIVSTDYEIGFPVHIQTGRISARLRVYHRSSHVGDEFFINNPTFNRFDLTYEAVEALLAASVGSVRVYAAGDYMYHNVTTSIDPGVLKGGADFVSPTSFKLGSLDGRWIAGAEVKSIRDLEWKTAKSGIAGFELSRSATTSPSMRIFLELYSGPSNAGQFYGTSESYFGIGGYIFP